MRSRGMGAARPLPVLARATRPSRRVRRARTPAGRTARGFGSDRTGWWAWWSASPRARRSGRLRREARADPMTFAGGALASWRTSGRQASRSSTGRSVPLTSTESGRSAPGRGSRPPSRSPRRAPSRSTAPTRGPAASARATIPRAASSIRSAARGEGRASTPLGDAPGPPPRSPASRSTSRARRARSWRGGLIVPAGGSRGTAASSVNWLAGPSPPGATTGSPIRRHAAPGDETRRAGDDAGSGERGRTRGTDSSSGQRLLPAARGAAARRRWDRRQVATP